jgi:monoamine oxidase
MHDAGGMAHVPGARDVRPWHRGGFRRMRDTDARPAVRDQQRSAPRVVVECGHRTEGRPRMTRSLFIRLRRRYAPRTGGISRREMLKTTLAASAGWLLSSRLPAPVRAAAARRVVVVGAGFSGLAAAHELHAAGYRVTVLDARNRVGGRVLSFSDLVPGKTMEGGAELIGANHPTWAAFKERFDLDFLEIPDDELDSPIVLGGRRLEDREARRLWEECEHALGAMNADAAQVPDPFEPWTTPGARGLDERTLASWIARQPVSALCKQALDAQISGDNGVISDWQSYLANLALVKGGGLDRYWTASESFRCRGGNQTLARRLAATLPADAVRLGVVVRALDVSDPVARVVLADGTVLDCDDVVLTAPPSVWTRIGFTPPLPAHVLPQMGSNVKYLMSVRGEFWRRLKRSAAAFSDGPTTWTWHATEGQRGPGTGMVAFSGAEDAEECRSWAPRERDERYLAALSRIYPNVRAHFVRGRFMDWPGDAWSKASYSFPAPGQVTTIGPVLREGLAGRLHFAGEHTCYAFVGYMEGALWSGVRVARALAARDGIARP